MVLKQCGIVFTHLLNHIHIGVIYFKYSFDSEQIMIANVDDMNPSFSKNYKWEFEIIRTIDDLKKVMEMEFMVNHDSMTNPENGYVEGFYYQDLDNGVVKHYIFNCPMKWEVDPSTVRIIRHDDLHKYINPVTTINDIKELQQKLVQTCIDFIKEKNLTDIDAVSFNVDGLEDSIKFGVSYER